LLLLDVFFWNSLSLFDERNVETGLRESGTLHSKWNCTHEEP
jgi:hypothetical protein